MPQVNNLSWFSISFKLIFLFLIFFNVFSYNYQFNVPNSKKINLFYFNFMV